MSMRLGFGKRPLWRNYLAAFFLIAGGFMLGDITVLDGARGVEIVSTVMFFAGLLVFAAALASSIWFVIARKP